MIDFATTATKLAGLGHEQRLRLFHVLIRAGHEGLTVGEIQKALGRPMSTVSFHLRELVNAGMIVQEKRGRSVYCRASFEALNEMMAFISDECCKGVSIPKPVRR
jgi:ArsR family transcriptional regulator